MQPNSNMKAHHVDICEYARNCSPYDDDERSTDELIDAAIHDGVVDETRDELLTMAMADDAEAREYLLESLGDDEQQISDFLEIECFRSTTNPDNCIVDFLLGCGGPTVRITVDTRWNAVTLFHSWGYHVHDDRECSEWDICGALRDEWLAVAELFTEGGE